MRRLRTLILVGVLSSVAACRDATAPSATKSLSGRTVARSETGVEDITRPTMTAVRFTPVTIDVSAAAQTVKLTVHVTDDLSGFQRGFFQLTSPSGRQSLFGVFNQLVSGTLTDGDFEGQIDVPRFSETGSWHFVYLRVDDLANNVTTLFEPSLTELGLSPTLEVTGVADLAAPSVVNISFDPASVDVTAGPAEATFTAHIRDDFSGFQRGFFQLTSPSGAQSVFGSFTELVSGDANDGTYRARITLPQFSEAGAWHFVYLRLDDLTNNVATLFEPQLTELGLSPELTVTSVSDAAAPTLVGVTFDPTSIDVSRSPRTVTLRVHVRDDVSGFQRGFFQLTSPSGAQSLFGLFQQLVSGDAYDGTYQTEITFPQFSETGLWRFGYLRVDDLANNVATLFEPELNALGITQRVLVTVAPLDETPPAISPTVTGTVGSNGWYTSDIGISWTVADDESTISSTSGCGDRVITADVENQVITCTAASAGGSDTKSVTVKRDATPPVVAFSGNAGRYAVDQMIAIGCSASDAMSGLMASICPSVSAPAYTFPLGANVLDASATDRAGNVRAVSTGFVIEVTAGSIRALTIRFCSSKGVTNGLLAKLDAAEASWSRGDMNATRGQLEAYVNQVQAQMGKCIAAGDADILIRLARSLYSQ